MARNTLTISAVHHLLHGRNIFRPYVRAWYSVTRSLPRPLPIINMFANLFAYPIIHCRRRPLVARTTLVISAPHQLWHGRNIFRPDVGHWWRLTACLFLPHITFCTGEKYFAPTFAIVTPSPDRHHGRCQSSKCSQLVRHIKRNFSNLCQRLWARCSAWAQNISPRQPSQLDPHTNIWHINY